MVQKLINPNIRTSPGLCLSALWEHFYTCQVEASVPFDWPELA